MFTLYYKPTCAFSQRVIQMADNLNGSTLTPFLVDTETNITMHESSDIIDYLREHGKGVVSPISASKPRVHVGGSVCESCEG
jgi:hypothetical protein